MSFLVHNPNRNPNVRAALKALGLHHESNVEFDSWDGMPAEKVAGCCVIAGTIPFDRFHAAGSVTIVPGLNTARKNASARAILGCICEAHPVATYRLERVSVLHTADPTPPKVSKPRGRKPVQPPAAE